MKLYETLAAFWIAFAIPVRCQVSGGVEMDFSDRYTWRGIAYSSGPVLQPDLWVTYDRFTLSGWANYVLTNEPQQGTINSSSGSLDYAFELGKFQIDPMIEYWSDREIRNIIDKPTGEVSVNVSHTLGPVSVYTLQAVDAFRYPGAWYGESGATREFRRRRLATTATVRLSGANRTYLQLYAGVAKAAFVDAGGELELKAQVSKHFYLRPHVEWTYLLDHQVRRVVTPASLWNLGAALGVTF